MRRRKPTLTMRLFAGLTILLAGVASWMVLPGDGGPHRL